ncbi:unnamed protein product [Pedinophyceae sp. YPF-701]|nr:unnamed protein product [Pedinophyceae sp. YPF-701]
MLQSPATTMHRAPTAPGPAPCRRPVLRRSALHGSRRARACGPRRPRMSPARASPQQSSSCECCERILRYTDGTVRTIRYPCPDKDSSPEPRARASLPPGVGGDGASAAQTMRRMPRPSWPAGDVAGGSATPTAGRDTTAASAPASAAPEAKPAWNAAAEFLSYVGTDEYKEARRAEWRKVRASYEVCNGCPFVMTKPLYVLSVGRSAQDADYGRGYTIRTEVADTNEQADEMARVLQLKNQKEGEAPILRVRRMLDGLVVFEGEDDAQQFAEYLEDDGHLDVAVASVDAHELFRMTNDVKAVVVLFREGNYIPSISQLTVALNGGRTNNPLETSSFDDI